MWILSQSKSVLAKCDRITIQHVEGKSYKIIGDGFMVLGAYSTEAKAKKVLEWCYEQIVRKDSPNILAMPPEDEI